MQFRHRKILTIELDNRKDVNDDEYKKIVDIIGSLEKQMLTPNGYLIPQKSSVRTKPSTMRLLKE